MGERKICPPYTSRARAGSSRRWGRCPAARSRASSRPAWSGSANLRRASASGLRSRQRAAIREKAASLEFAKNSSGRSLSGSRVGNTPRAPAISSLGSFSSPPALMGQDMMSRSLARHATE